MNDIILTMTKEEAYAMQRALVERAMDLAEKRNQLRGVASVTCSSSSRKETHKLMLEVSNKIEIVMRLNALISDEIEGA